MVIIILAGLFVAAVFGPSLWASWTLKRHNIDRTDLPGTGGELAQHLVDHYGIDGVTVESSGEGSHYSPDEKAVRLEKRFFDGRSVSAVAVAAHEVGHAIQDFENYPPLRTRHRLVSSTISAQKIARVALYAAPFAGLLGRHPAFAMGTLLIGVLSMATTVIVHLVTLPVEFHASFARALPMLKSGGYLADEDLPAARLVLKACALTYVASALMSMFNLLRWLRAIR